jgi:tRNA threonylcarbamoyladenosine biosynthesis protein TsaE
MATDGNEIVMEPLETLGEVAKRLLSIGGDRKIWLLQGGMGAGKTTLVKHLCRELGVSASVQSPTFSLVNEYLTDRGSSVFHFDLYRLKNTRELLEIGIEEYLDSGNYCFIEWPEIGGELWPEDAFTLVLEQNNAGERVIHPSMPFPHSSRI